MCQAHIGTSEDQRNRWDLPGELVSEGLSVEVLEYRYDDEIANGIIISQTPEADEMVVEGSVIKIIVSMGKEPDVKLMDNLIGEDFNKVVIYLVGQGLQVDPYEEYNDEVPEGKVIKTDPAAGTELKEGQIIKVYYSLGAEPKMVQFPNVVGLNYTTAYNQLNSLDFKNVTYEYADSDKEKDQVIDQPYARGTKVDVTEQIVLIISKGPVETTEATTEPTTAPTTEPTTAPTTEPTTEATTEPIVEVSKTVTIELPMEQEENYMLGLYQNGKAVIEETEVAAGTANLAVTLSGTGVQYYDIYINNNYYKTLKVDFGVNG